MRRSRRSRRSSAALQVRLRQRRRGETARRRFERGDHPLHFGEEAGAELALEWRLKAYRHWLTMPEPTWANVSFAPIDYQDAYYYSGSEVKDGRTKDGEIDPELKRTYEKLGIPLQEQQILAGVAVDAVFDSVSVATTFKSKLEEYGNLLLDIGSGSETSRCGSEVPRQRCPLQRQQARHPQLRGVHRRHIRLRAAGGALSDGVIDLFSHQRGEDRAVRADADHRRPGRVRQLSRRLHRADARRKSAACGGGRTGRAR